jgi:hypothetical protein
MADEIKELRRQTFRYYYQDGLVELAVGLLFLVIGLDTWLISSVPSGTTLATAAWILLPLLTIGGVFGVQRLVIKLKERWVYPRTGYVEYGAKPSPYRWLVVGASLVLVVATFVLPYPVLDKMSVIGGVLLFIILASIGVQIGLGRLVVVAGLALASGILFAFITDGEVVGITLTFAVTGAALMLAGGWGLQSYLAENPEHQEGDDE